MARLWDWFEPQSPVKPRLLLGELRAAECGPRYQEVVKSYLVVLLPGRCVARGIQTWNGGHWRSSSTVGASAGRLG